MTRKIKVHFFGSFSVNSPDGTNLTPKSTKARGLLALLCEAKDMRRGRRWLAAMLWSDRGPSQASGSLRQALFEVRSALGKHSDVLRADRIDIWLEADDIETDLTTEGSPGREGREFLEGLDVRDEAFQEWAREARARYDPPFDEPLVSSRARSDANSLAIRAAPSSGGSPFERLAGTVIADEIARSLQDRLAAQRFAHPSEKEAYSLADVEVRCDVAEDHNRSVVFVRIESVKEGHILFSGHRSLNGTASDAISAETVDGLVHSAAAKMVHRLPRLMSLDRPEIAALGYSSAGISKLSAFTPEAFAEAQDCFERAYDADRSGVFLAWRAFVRMAQLVEGAGGNQAAWRDEVEELSRRVVEEAPDNGFALALIALTRVMLREPVAPSMQIAEDAIRQSGSALFARQTLAVAHSTIGNVKEAYTLSRSCQNAALEDDLAHVWNLYHALVCIASGRLEEARLAAAQAAEASPGFVAPRRQLVALCANAGDIVAARKYLSELSDLEHGFTLDRYLNDDRYPVITVRRAGLIESVRNAPLSD